MPKGQVSVFILGDTFSSEGQGCCEMVSFKILETFSTEAGGPISNLGRVFLVFVLFFPPGSHRTLP